MTDTTYTTEQIRAMLGGINRNWMNEISDRGGMGWDIEGVCTGGRGMFCRKEDAEFAAAAPAIVKQLLDEIERLKAGD